MEPTSTLLNRGLVLSNNISVRFANNRTLSFDLQKLTSFLDVINPVGQIDLRSIDESDFNLMYQVVVECRSIHELLPQSDTLNPYLLENLSKIPIKNRGMILDNIKADLQVMTFEQAQAFRKGYEDMKCAGDSLPYCADRARYVFLIGKLIFANEDIARSHFSLGNHYQKLTTQFLRLIKELQDKKPDNSTKDKLRLIKIQNATKEHSKLNYLLGYWKSATFFPWIDDETSDSGIDIRTIRVIESKRDSTDPEIQRLVALAPKFRERRHIAIIKVLKATSANIDRTELLTFLLEFLDHYEMQANTKHESFTHRLTKSSFVYRLDNASRKDLEDEIRNDLIGAGGILDADLPTRLTSEEDNVVDSSESRNYRRCLGVK